MRFEPYEHQAKALEDLYDYCREHPGCGDISKCHPALVLPTGSGKSLVIAEAVRKVIECGKRALVLHHNAELISQNSAAYARQFRTVNFGINCAGLGRRDFHQGVVFCSIQSVYQKAEQFGARAVVFVDECHLINPLDETMFAKFLSDMKRLADSRVVGLTATPYRMGLGLIAGPDRPFSHIAHTTTIPELIEADRISPVRNAKTDVSVSMDGCAMNRGEFVLEEMSSRFSIATEAAVEEIVAIAERENRKHCLIFTTSVSNAELTASLIRKVSNDDARIVCGMSTPLERATNLGLFCGGDLRYLVNVNVLTTGFDAPHIDLIAVLRATTSPGLFAQICGRGFRKSPGKTDCLLLDFGGNLSRHGCLDSVDYGARSLEKKGDSQAPVKTCPGCNQENPASARVCRFCPVEFEVSEVEQFTPSEADENAVLEADAVEVRERLRVFNRDAKLHRKRGWKEGDPISVCVTYLGGEPETDAERASIYITPFRSPITYRQVFLFPEHKAFARSKSKTWFEKRSRSSFPDTAVELLELFNSGAVAEDVELEFCKFNYEGEYWRLDDVGSIIGEIPELTKLDI